MPPEIIHDFNRYMMCWWLSWNKTVHPQAQICKAMI